MLLGSAAADVATQEKIPNISRTDKAREGRAEKINETATALAINDYVAGKRSKENLAQTLACRL